jgi:hypothetical protein
LTFVALEVAQAVRAFPLLGVDGRQSGVVSALLGFVDPEAAIALALLGVLMARSWFAFAL